MASTPDTSFSGCEGCPRPLKASTDGPLPPSPQVSETETDAASEPDVARKCLHQPTTGKEAIKKAYEAVWQRFCGLPSEKSYPTFHLEGQNAYDRLHEKIASHPGLLAYFEEDIRKDWDASTGELTLRLMALPLHDVFKRSVEAAIESQLAIIARTNALPYKIISGSHSKIQKRRSKSRPYFDKSPDGQFYYDSALNKYRYPPFVFEVAYSQDERDVKETARSFLRTLPAKVCTVLAIEIDYTEPEGRKEEGHCHSASFTLWTTEQDQEREQGTITVASSSRQFRDNEGNSFPGELTLPLKLFLPLQEREACPDENIRLSFASLSEFVNTAERRQRLVDASPTPQPERIMSIRWRDEDGDITEQKLPEPKRKRTAVVPSTRTRSSSQPRRSSRLRSASRGRDRSSRDIRPGSL